MLTSTFLFLTTLLSSSITTAHFLLDWPPSRPFDEDTLGTFPCGGQSAPSPNRTAISLTSLPIALTMGHDRTVIQILLGLGNTVGDSFNIVLEPTFAQVGLGSFCLPDVPLPADLKITEGMNATVQVVTDGEGGGGLYNVRFPPLFSSPLTETNGPQCADITFTSTAPTVPSTCSNGTGVMATLLPAAEAAINANASSATGGPASGGESASASGSVASATASPTGGANVLARGAGAVGVVVLGVAALL